VRSPKGLATTQSNANTPPAAADVQAPTPLVHTPAPPKPTLQTVAPVFTPYDDVPSLPAPMNHILKIVLPALPPLFEMIWMLMLRTFVPSLKGHTIYRISFIVQICISLVLFTYVPVACLA